MTTASGEFTIPLRQDLKPGDEVVFDVAGWVVVSPYDGRAFVPRQGAVGLLVARKGDPTTLDDKEYIARLIQDAVTKVTVAAALPPSPDVFLTAKAAELGLSVADLKQAIETWTRQVQSPYQRGLAALLRQHYDEASQLLRTAIGQQEGELVDKYLVLGRAEIGRGQYAVAVGILQKAHRLRPESATVLNNLGSALHWAGRYQEVEPLLRRALAIDQKTIGPDHPNIATHLDSLSSLYDSQGRYTEAETLSRRALDIAEKGLGPDHEYIAAYLNTLALVLHGQGRYTESELLLRRALAIAERRLGTEHPEVAVKLNNLGITSYSQGRDAEAEMLLRRALMISEKALGPGHPDVGARLHNLASLYYRQSRYSEAEPLFRRALAIDETTLGADHPTVATTLNALARLYRDQRRYAEAEPLFRRALDIGERTLHAGHPQVTTIMKDFAALLSAIGQDTAAAELRERVSTGHDAMP